MTSQRMSVSDHELSVGRCVGALDGRASITAVAIQSLGQETSRAIGDAAPAAANAEIRPRLRPERRHTVDVDA